MTRILHRVQEVAKNLLGSRRWMLGGRWGPYSCLDYGYYSQFPLPTSVQSTPTPAALLVGLPRLLHTQGLTSTMAAVTPIPIKKVELHVHLDGAVRPETAYEFAVKRNLKLPVKNVEELKSVVQQSSQGNLVKFLESFTYFVPPIAGCEEAIERMAYEFCEDCSRQNIIYVEVRYSPHFLASTVKHDFCEHGNITPDCVIQCINNGFKRGSAKFGINVKTILCCIRTKPEWSEEILSLAKKYMSEGVVGIDLAGDERFANPSHEAHIKVFQEAKNIGLGRTVHAGENGPAANVAEAIDVMHAQRIGHGYHTLDDAALYARCIEKDIHFEQCPYSSYCTGSVEGDRTKHPLIRFFKDKANVSINTDDPIITDRTLSEEYELVRDKMSLGWKEMTDANINAAKASFLPEKEKKNLINQLQEGYKKQEDEGAQ